MVIVPVGSLSLLLSLDTPPPPCRTPRRTRRRRRSGSARTARRRLAAGTPTPSRCRPPLPATTRRAAPTTRRSARWRFTPADTAPARSRLRSREVGPRCGRGAGRRLPRRRGRRSRSRCRRSSRSGAMRAPAGSAIVWPGWMTWAIPFGPPVGVGDRLGSHAVAIADRAQCITDLHDVDRPGAVAAVVVASTRRHVRRAGHRPVPSARPISDGIAPIVTRTRGAVRPARELGRTTARPSSSRFWGAKSSVRARFCLWKS